MNVTSEELEMANTEAMRTRPSSKSVPQRGQKPEPPKKEKPESPLPTIQRIDIQPIDPPTMNINRNEAPPPPPRVEKKTQSLWQPLEEMFVPLPLFFLCILFLQNID